MPRLVVIEGCGPMVCSDYGEMTAAVDRAFASPPEEALPIPEVFASLAAGLKAVPPRPRQAREPELSV